MKIIGQKEEWQWILFEKWISETQNPKDEISKKRIEVIRKIFENRNLWDCFEIKNGERWNKIIINPKDGHAWVTT